MTRATKELDKQGQRLRRVLKYLSRSTTPGCLVGADFCLVHWPDLLARPRSAQTLMEKTALISPSRLLSKRMADIREETEKLLGPLRLPLTAFTSRCLIADHRHTHPQPTSTTDQYTIFRKLGAYRESLVRVNVTPPSLDDLALNSAGIPPEILALGHAWHALANRGQAPFDPADVGVEFARDGRLVVNWRLFSKSTYWPVSIPTDAVGVMYDLEGRRGLKSALEDRNSSRYKRLCEEARIHLSEDGLDAPCSVVDQLWLSARPRWFNAAWHQSRSVRLLPARATASRKRTARIYRYPFSSDVKNALPVWADLSEVVVAIYRRRELFFAAPRQLHLEMPPAGRHELEAWQKSLDEFLLTELFGPDGHVGNVAEKSRSVQFQTEHRARMEQTARELFRNYVDLESLSKSSIRQVRRHLARRYAESEPHGAGSRWYHDWLVEKARDRIPVAAVRRLAKVIDAERWPEPTLVSFFGHQALEVFEKTARSMKAPYLQAWAAFCLELAARDPRLRDSEDDTRGNGWTPAEDFELLTRYHSSPRMTEVEWKHLLEVLAPRNRRACQARISDLNAVVKKLVSAAGRGDWRVGRKRLPGAKAKRTICLIGICRRSKRHDLTINSRTPAVRKVRNMSDAEALGWALPSQYASSDFDRWLAV
jgi:hypothetical protein